MADRRATALSTGGEEGDRGNPLSPKYLSSSFSVNFNLGIHRATRKRAITSADWIVKSSRPHTHRRNEVDP